MTAITRRAVLGLAAAGLAGCASVPTSGPVEQVSPSAQASLERGVQVRPAPPQVDGSPEVVMAGFIDALASLEPDFQVARQYLTPVAAAKWDPRAGVTVFDGDRRTNLSSAESAALEAPLVGRLDRAGHFTPAQGALRHDFGMVKVEGQWRIGTPPDGLLVSNYTLLHRFTSAEIWFLDPSATRVVPELVWLAQNPPTPTQLVQALLLGPSAGLRPAVSTAIPSGTRLAAPAVTVDDQGVAEVALTEAVANLPDRQRTQLAAQLLWTLRHFENVLRLRVSVDGKTWSLPGAGTDGTIGEVDTLGFSPVSITASRQPLVVVKGGVGRMDGPEHSTPVSGSFGHAGWGQPLAELAAHDATGQLAVVNAARTQLAVGPIDKDGVKVVLTGRSLGRPQYDGTGQLWVLTDTDQPRSRLVRIDVDGHPTEVSAALPSGHRLVGFSISPSGARLALVTQAGTRRLLGMAVLHGTDAPSLASYRELPLADSQALHWVLDVGWSSPTTLLVLAAPDQTSRASVLQVTCDGAQSEALGPTGDAEPVRLVVQPTLDGQTAALVTRRAHLLSLESAWRWQANNLDVTTATFAR